MNVYAIKESALNETDGISFNIYLSGCKGYCEGCHSDHTWDFNSGSNLIVCDLIDYMYSIDSFKFDHICILGGEPLDQPKEELLFLLEELKIAFRDKPIWLYTHFELDEIDKEIATCSSLDYIKTGKYEKDLPEAEEQYGVFLASDNQKIHKLT